MTVVRRIKSAYFKAVLEQESAWFDQVNYTELASRISAECNHIEVGIGQKYGQLLQALAMSLSGLLLAFIKGWSLALPMLLLCPIIFIGLSTLIKGATA